MTRLDRRALFASGAAAALLSASGLSAQAKPRAGGRLRVGLSGANRADTWGRIATADAGLFLRMAGVGGVFDTLTEIGPDGALRGELATDWRGSSDAKDWQFDLRDDVSFHNGSGFDADDVVASLSANADLIGLDRIERLGRHRVSLRLTQGDPNLPMRLSNAAHVIAPAALGVDAGIGTGLYSLRRFDAGRQFIGERVETHYKDGQSGWFETIEFVSIPDAQVRMTALREGLVDVVDQTDGAQISTQVARPTPVGQSAPMDNLRMAERWWFA